MLPKTKHRGRVFDWFPSRDNRRGNFMLRAANLEQPEIQPKLWASRITTDQGREGACVGHGITCDILASPKPFTNVDFAEANAFAFKAYKRCQKLDYWSGEAYEGTSVDAGFQVQREMGVIDEWRWMSNTTEIRDAILGVGPVVLGIPWLDGMYETRPSGMVEVDGNVVGGHCITILGYHPGMRIAGEDWNARYEVFKWKNSWGSDYGKKGFGYVKVGDLQELLNMGGEAGVAMGRKRVTELTVAA